MSKVQRDINRLYSGHYAEIIIFAHLLNILIKAKKKDLGENNKVVLNLKKKIESHEWHFSNKKPIKIINKELVQTKDVSKDAILHSALETAEMLEHWNETIPLIKTLQYVKL